MRAEYIDHLGSDLTCVNAARVSFDKESDWEYHEKFSGAVVKDLSDKDVRLISYLAKNGHWSPFSHTAITFRETVPIFVARQRFKHMVGFTYNEVSRRYVDDAPEFYTPDEWRSRPSGSVKQGSGEGIITAILRPQIFSVYQKDSKVVEREVDIQTAYEEVVRKCTLLYNDMIKTGVAPEQARMVLPQSMMTSYYVTGSLYAFARAYKQRIDAHAQKEIRDLAMQWDTIIRPLFPVSWSALVDEEV